jgi:hypothetical protein
MSQVEEEFGEAKTRYLQCLAPMQEMSDRFGEMTDLFWNCKEPLKKLNKTIKKYTDAAGGFMSDDDQGIQGRLT